MPGRDQQIETGFVYEIDTQSLSSDPEGKYLPVRRYAPATDESENGYGGSDTFGELSVCGGPDTLGDEDILL